jgi:GntP family gluconate:H+ symporter
LTLNLLGFLVAISVMCCIFAYVIFIPIAREIAAKQEIPIGVAATSLSLGTLASYELIYPAPSVYSAANELGVVGTDIVLLGILIAIPTSVMGYICMRSGFASSAEFRQVWSKRSNESVQADYERIRQSSFR